MQAGNWHQYKERVLRPQTGKNDSGIPAITVQIDFKGNTGCVAARPPLTETEGEVFPGVLGAASSTDVFASASSREW